MQTNISSEMPAPHNVSYFPSLYNPIPSICSGIYTYFFGVSGTPCDTKIPHATPDIATSPLVNLPTTPPQLADDLLNYETLPELGNVITPQLSASILYQFIDEDAFTLARKQQMSSLGEKRQMLDEEKKELEQLKSEMSGNLNKRSAYYAACEAYNKHLDSYRLAEANEETLICEKLMGCAIRGTVLPALSLDDNPSTIVSTQLIMVDFPGKPNHFSALISIFAPSQGENGKLKAYQGVLCGEAISRDGEIRVHHFLTYQEIKQSTADALQKIFPEKVLSFIQMQAHIS